MPKHLLSVLGFCGVLLAHGAYAQTIPPPWLWTDDGANNDWFVSGAGRNIWGTADSFVFAYQPIRDGRIDATIDGETNTSPFAKAGVMIRQTLAPDHRKSSSTSSRMAASSTWSALRLADRRHLSAAARFR